MKRYSGKTVCKGIALGRIRVLKNFDCHVKRTKITDTEAEIQRLKKALEAAKEQLDALYQKAVSEVGEASAAIFEIHKMLLEDEDYTDAIFNIIQTESVDAAYAAASAGDTFAEIFSNMEDEYMRARAADIKDISNRLVRILSGSGSADLSSDEPAIIVASDLSPSETVQLDKSRILAFVTIHGSTNSHTAILARMMSIPALVGVPLSLDEINSGDTAIVDGNTSEFLLSPDEASISHAEKLLRDQKESTELLQQMKGQDTVTRSGRHINLYANIGNTSDLGYVLKNDAAGIGLFRSEFLYLSRNDFPTEEEQFQAYRQVLQTMAGKKVIIRTLDIGADKQADYFHLKKEENPAMGYRAIRICLTQPDIFKTQLRALFRSAIYGNLSIMYPMIISSEELDQIHAVTEEVQNELEQSRIPYKIPEQGIMIETPAAAIISDELARKTDFFSIGTNDLTQYTLAIDRQNEELEKFYQPHHPAILRMIQMVIDNAHKHGKWAGICGELGADTTLTKQFIKMGIDELSVSPSMILPIRKQIREME